MARRNEARVPTSIWRDRGFRSLAAHTQWLYLALLASPELDPGGVMPLLPRRWALLAHGVEEDLNIRGVWALHEVGLVFADHDDQEIFVAGFFESESIGQQPRRVTAAMDAFGLVRSEPLRAFASAELSAQVAAREIRAPRGLRRIVLERDGWACQICGWKPGDPVPAKRDRTLYRGLEIDHVHPKSRGGKDELENFQVLCTTCNASKGATV